MSCASCVGRIEKALKSVPGVLEASVNLATEKALVRTLAGAVPISDLEAAVRGAGYKAKRVGDRDMAAREAEAHEREVRSLGRSVWLATLLSLPVFVLEMGAHLMPGIYELVAATIGQEGSGYLQVPLGAIVQFGHGLLFFQPGVKSDERRGGRRG